MYYYGDNEDSILVECNSCSKVLKIRKIYFNQTEKNTYVPNTLIACLCGNKTQSELTNRKSRNSTSKVLCSRCGSSQVSASKKGFGFGKATVGVILTGGIGLLAGGIGSNKIIVTCLNCGHNWKV